jgi:hypothetical protein
MKLPHVCLLTAAIVVGTFACQSASDSEDDTADNTTEDEVIFVKGNADHAAIVESTTIMLVATPTIAPPLDPALDRYNVADPFDIGASGFRDVFKTNIEKFDALDGQEDWSAAQKTAWVARMASSNYVTIDTSLPCDFDDPRTYLEIERAELSGVAHSTCGGRMPNEDALDVTLNFLVRGPGASAEDEDALHDGVDSATKPSESTFPYLGEMNGL